MRDYTKIVAWALADDLTAAVYKSTIGFPKDELYGLTSQMRRASFSVPANIVEGSSRDTNRDYLRFLHIARGSLSETHYFVHLARRLGYLNEQGAEALNAQMNRTFACLHGLICAVEREAQKERTLGR
jgi:four helix bundle protein